MAQQAQETPKKKVYVKPSLEKREQLTEITENGMMVITSGVSG